MNNEVAVEISTKVAVSFKKRYKDLSITTVKQDLAEYLKCHKKAFENNKICSFVYDYDREIVVTIIKRYSDCEVYDVLGFLDMSAPEETFEDDEEKAETKKQLQILKENEKSKMTGAKQLQSIYEGLGV